MVFNTFGENKWNLVFKVVWQFLPKINGHKWVLFASFCFYSKFVQILFGRIPCVIIVYVTGILEKMVKEFWQNTFVPCRINLKARKRYTLATVNISKILSKGIALSVFLPDRVAMSISLITWFCLVCIWCKFVLLLLPRQQ